jgi:hypothetical protein
MTSENTGRYPDWIPKYSIAAAASISFSDLGRPKRAEDEVH